MIIASCGSDFVIPAPVPKPDSGSVDQPSDKPGEESGDIPGDGSENGSGEQPGGNPDDPTVVVPSVPDAALVADGIDENTYSLILAKGYNYETPDASGNHASSPYRHIRQSYDSFLKRYVFDFILHIENDDDRGKANITDRQRNEIKTDAKSPASMVAQRGETLKMSWKFFLPAGMKTTTKFSHIHQLKGIDNKEENADVGMPLITFTARSMSNGTQQFQVIHTAPSSQQSKNTTIFKCPLDEFLGQWVEVEETVTFAESGTYQLIIRRMSDNKELVKISPMSLWMWRDGTTGLRPKWGLYRNFGENRSNAHLLRDEILRFADFYIEKLK